MADPLAVPAGSLALRTCWDHDEAWRELLALWAAPSAEGFSAFLSPVEDRRLDGLSPMEALDLLPHPGNAARVVVIVDRVCLEDPERAALVVDPVTREVLRVVPSEMWSIENNLSVANMSFAEFAASADADGVFRGFREPAPPGTELVEPRYTVELRWAGLNPPEHMRVEDFALTLPPSGVSVITTCEYDSLMRGRSDAGAGLHCKHAGVLVRLDPCPRCTGECRGHAFCPTHAGQRSSS